MSSLPQGRPLRTGRLLLVPTGVTSISTECLPFEAANPRVARTDTQSHESASATSTISTCEPGSTFGPDVATPSVYSGASVCWRPVAMAAVDASPDSSAPTPSVRGETLTLARAARLSVAGRGAHGLCRLKGAAILLTSMAFLSIETNPPRVSLQQGAGAHAIYRQQQQ